jgi:predicted ferric reductase
MGTTWTYVTQASGIVATVLLVLALGGGFLFSARATGRRRRPNWWLDLHNYLGGLALAFTALHIFAAYRDELSGIGLRQIFIPMTAVGWEWGITWGVLSTYALAAVVFTSWPKKRLPRRAWVIVHLLSMPATFLAAAHAWMVGSNRHGLWFHALLALAAGWSVYPAVLRLVGVLTKGRTRRARTTVVPTS